MPTDETQETAVHLGELNEELNNSLERCQELVDDYRVKIAANSNEPGTSEDEQEAG